MNKLTLAAMLVVALCSHRSDAIELLTGGDFEVTSVDPVGEIPGWDLEESIFDQTTMMRRDFGVLNTASQVGFAPEAGEFDLWLRAFVGGLTTGPDNLTNATLSQMVPVTPGESYTFSGWSRYETNYSGGADTLNEGGPLGAVASPTTNTFFLEFLDSSGSVIGSPTSLDVTADRTAQSGAPFFNDWIQHTIPSQAAPAGAVSARVIADAEQMVHNVENPQSAFYDSFSFTSATDPTTELLMNAGLDEAPPVPPEFDPAFMITERLGGVVQEESSIVRSAGFANRPDSGGSQGVWFSPFIGSEGELADGIVAQTVDGAAGEDYTFSAWSRFEANYVGGLDGNGVVTELQLSFLDSSGTEIGVPLSLDVKADREAQIGGSANDNLWYEHVLEGTAPAGTEMVRVLGQGLNMFSNPDGGAQSFFFDDFSLDLAGAGLAGDYNNDGIVDAADYTVWRDGNSPDSSQAGYDLWANNYGATAAPGNSASVPEPTTALIALIGLAGFMAKRR